MITTEQERPHRGVRIVVRPLGSPLPLGIFSFAVGMLILGVLATGTVPEREGSQVGMLLAAFVFPLEAGAAIFAFLARDTLAATVLGFFAGSWLSLGVSQIVSAPGSTSYTLGLFLLMFALVVFALAASAAMAKPIFTVLLALSGTRALLSGLFQLTDTKALDRAAGIVALVLAGVAVYAGVAFLLEDLRQRAVLPVVRRGVARGALEGDLSEQVQRATHEAGVRQQL